MSKLQMPPKGQSAAMMAALQAEHASQPHPDTNEATNVVTLQPTPHQPPPPTPPPSPATSAPAQPALPDAPEPASSRQDRFTFALERALHDEIAVVTVRVPATLNRYMDDFVARSNRVEPDHKYRKQDAVAQAFAAFYADHPMPPPPPDEDLS